MSGISLFLNVPGLRELNKDEKDRIKIFLESPGKDEFFFLLQMLGKTPLQVRNMMLEEFVRRFGLETHANEIKEALPPTGSWRALDVAVAGFGGTKGAEEHLRFWDRMRHVLEALPQRNDNGDKYGDAHEGRAAKPKRGWNYTTCKFCWRRVSYNSGVIRKTGSLCFKHNLPAMHPTYQKHRRLEQHFLTAQQPIEKSLMALTAECPSEQEAQDRVYSQLTAPDGCLPRLTEYLRGVGHDGTRESLLWAFHGPASDIEDSFYKDALDEYIRYTLDARDILDPNQPVSILSIDELSRAEAWLTLLDRDRRRK